MELNMNSQFLVILSVFVVLLILFRVLYTIWWRPKILENKLRNQGIRGNPYKLLQGDNGEFKRMMIEACSRPIPLTHRIAPRVTPFIHHMVQTYGKQSLSWFGTIPRLIIADSELLKLVLADKNNHFRKPPMNPLMELLSKGVFSLEGQKWAKRRRLISPAFHHQKIQGMLPAFSACCCDLLDRLVKLVSPSGSCEIDMACEFRAFSLDVIARTAFGSNYKEGEKIFALQKEQIVLAMEAYHDIYFPGLRFIPTKKNRRRYELDNQIKAILRDMIQKREENDTSNKDLDLLGLLLQCKADGNSEMTIEDIIEECKLFYFGAQESTSNLLTWTSIVLSMHPDWQEKARDEVLHVCGTRIPELPDLNRLKIVTMILHEVLRLYPPVVFFARHTTHMTELGNLLVPAGVEVYLPVLLMHYDKEHWGEDAEEFNPERFAEGVSNASKAQRAYFPFGWGAKICLGKSFAMLEAKLAIAMLLQRFSFELSPSYTHAPNTTTNLQPQHGATLILHQIIS
ncbi:cytochrome P450 CYP72A219-like [Impatiens glandulifera]|uniref:cytochrome P450 CYP72A219-like n=1 Tax=Impatiens glandulifera TaxID=253017 RepID=UPI001FB13460|nr:cytochrome P450 CYP72A219-like [Impatiens glandulifera]